MKDLCCTGVRVGVIVVIAYRRPMTRSRRSRFTARPVSNNVPLQVNKVEEQMVEVLDDLALFQELRAELLPELRRLIETKAPTKQILESARSAAVARLASLAVMDEDSKTALAAIKELLDRSEGKVTEKKEITHAMSKLKDEELDALVLSTLDEADSDGEE